MYEETTRKTSSVGKWIFGGVVAFAGLILFAMSAISVDVGERVVVVGFGEIKGTLTEGFQFVNPFYDTNRFTIRNDKYETTASSASSDLQSASVNVAVNFQLNEDKIEDVYRVYGNDYMARIFRQNVEEATKVTTAKYLASELITKREVVRDEIKANLQEMVSDVVTITDVAITNIEFSASFNSAIERKVVAEQQALEAKANLERSKLEAEAIRVQAQAINNQGGVEYVQLQAIAKWNGVLPTTTGGAVPFLNIK